MTLKTEDIIMENKTTEKETIDPGAVSEREEGEISDLDLEDVSDCTLTSTHSNYRKKYNIKNSKSHISEYFSCVSDSDSDNSWNDDHNFEYAYRSLKCTYGRTTSDRYESDRDRHYKYKCGKPRSRLMLRLSSDSDESPDNEKKHFKSRRVLSSSTDSESDSVDRSLLVKLNKAVRVNKSSSEQLQTSLQSRLKNMAAIVKSDGTKSSDSECELMELRKLALESKLKENRLEKHQEYKNNVEDSSKESSLNDENKNDCELTTSRTSPKPPSSPVKDDAKDEILDDEKEAQQLRMDALRSAILKKHMLRRQKQIPKDSCSNQNQNTETDSVSAQINTVITDLLDYIISDSEHRISDCSSSIDENSVSNKIENINDPDQGVLDSNCATNIEENNKENQEIETKTETEPPSEPPPPLNDNNKSIEEDEDILRAMLLTSVAKKIAEKKEPPLQKVTKPIAAKKTKKPKAFKKSSNEMQTKKQQPINVPVQRLVINVGDDSESDSCNENTHKPKIPPQFEASLSQLLKEARANVEKQQHQQQIKNSKMPSAVQRLPESRQMEYLQLKKRLEQLSNNKKPIKLKTQQAKTTKLINSPDKRLFPMSANDILKKMPNKSLRANKRNRYSATMDLIGKRQPQTVAVTTQQLNKILTPATDNKILKNPVATVLKKSNLQNTPSTNAINQKRCLEGKYKDLVPIVKKTKAARIARDRAGEEVTRLIEELKQARARYNEHHQTYKNCIQEYILLKSTIEAETQEDNRKRQTFVDDSETAATKRQKVQENVALKIVVQPLTLTTTMVQSVQTKITDTDVKLPSSTEPLVVENPKNETSTNDHQTDNTDNTSSTIKAKRRSIDSNPLIEVCPFDLQGSCRDSECKYRHLD